MALAASLLLGPAPGVVAQTASAPDAAVQVTATPSSARAHAIPVVAVDPRDPNVVAIAQGETERLAAGCTSRPTPA